MREFLKNQLGEITEQEFAVALGAGDNYFEQCKNRGENTTMAELLETMAGSIKRFRRG
jgi:ArsR family metal-binding transcriptional regulator